jgi:protein-S-isoprenylcysteine O-methyltransferase Ste14
MSGDLVLTAPAQFAVARYACLLIPLALLLATLPRGRAAAEAKRERGAALLAFIAAAVGVAALNEVATAAGWWRYADVDGAFRGVPVDLWLGWAVLWGPVPVLLHRLVPVPVAVGVLLWLDLATMPKLHTLEEVGPGWIAGELLGVAAVALPAILLGRWTARGQRLAARAVLQLTVFTGLVLWLIPTAAFSYGDGSWAHLWRLPGWALSLLVQALALTAVPALAAMREFAKRGGGTPYPWDPPVRLVTTGPYAYLGNPMQCGAVLMTLLLAAGAGSLTLAAAAVSGVAFSVALAAPHEHADLARRFGAGWRAYRGEVRDWWPRLRPYHAGVPAVVWLDADCGPCSAVWRALARRSPTGLAIAAAAEHPQVLWRARYTGAYGRVERGVAAVARAFEHTHLGWAYASWALRLPAVAQLAQLLTDALIAPPHPARAVDTADAAGLARACARSPR